MNLKWVKTMKHKLSILITELHFLSWKKFGCKRVQGGCSNNLLHFFPASFSGWLRMHCEQWVLPCACEFQVFQEPVLWRYVAVAGAAGLTASPPRAPPAPLRDDILTASRQTSSTLAFSPTSAIFQTFFGIIWVAHIWWICLIILVFVWWVPSHGYLGCAIKRSPPAANSY